MMLVANTLNVVALDKLPVVKLRLPPLPTKAEPILTLPVLFRSWYRSVANELATTIFVDEPLQIELTEAVTVLFVGNGLMVMVAEEPVKPVVLVQFASATETKV